MKKVIKFIKPRIVKVTCPEMGLKGTGFIISEEGHIATNFHVIGQVDQNGRVHYAKKITVSNLIIGETDATIVHDIKDTASVLHDYSIIKIDKNGLEHFEIGKGNEVEEGDEVYFGGFPITQNTLTSHKGYVSSLRKAPTRFGTDFQKVIDIDGTVVGGNSGGPLIIKKGENYIVVGIISQQVAYLSEAFQHLEQFLKVQMTSPNAGSVFIGGMNPNAALFETIKTLKTNLSTGIGTAIFVDYLGQEFEKIKK